MNPPHQKDKRANPVSRGKYREGPVPIAAYGSDILAGYEFLQTQKNLPHSGERDMLLQLWEDGVEGYLRDKSEEDKEDVEWVENGNIGETEICTFDWIAKGLLGCDPDKIRVKLVELKQKKTRKLYKQIGFRQWRDGQRAGWRRT